jgi:hypothetical protein
VSTHPAEYPIRVPATALYLLTPYPPTCVRRWQLFQGASFLSTPLRRPRFLPVVASNLLAKTLLRAAPEGVDGFVVEMPAAGAWCMCAWVVGAWEASLRCAGLQRAPVKKMPEFRSGSFAENGRGAPHTVLRRVRLAAERVCVAGGHNAPPRGVMQLDEAGQPVYGPKDEVDLQQLAQLGKPFWCAQTRFASHQRRTNRSLPRQ